MILKVVHLPSARRDLVEQFRYFEEYAGSEIAERFVTAIDATCRLILVHPRSGLLCSVASVRLRGLRRLPVQGFESYLIFYLPKSHGINVIRVLHGDRDIDNLFTVV